MRHTKGHTGNRRSHHGLKEPRLSTCEKCSEVHVRHQACPKCGTYRGRQVVDVATRDERNRLRKETKKRAIGEVQGDTRAQDDSQAGDEEETQPLSPEELSKK